MRWLVTGAAGFLGRYVVEQALTRRHHVVGLIRPERDVSTLSWAARPGTRVAKVDLALEGVADAIADALAGVDAVIHVAGATFGPNEAHHRDTVGATRQLLASMRGCGVRRMVLVSSLSVYGYTSLPEGSQLDETTPTEHDVLDRDAYCRAKLAQESLVLAEAQRHGLAVTCLRPGAIFGPGRLWTSRLGYSCGPVAVLFGGAARLPLTYVLHCAQAAVLAAESDSVASDVYVEADPSGRCGAFEIINVIDDEQPSQREYFNLLRGHGGAVPSLSIRVPWPALRTVGALAGVLRATFPSVGARLPHALRHGSMSARIKPLRYSNCRLRDRLDWRPINDLQAAVTASIGKA